MEQLGEETDLNFNTACRVLGEKTSISSLVFVSPCVGNLLHDSNDEESPLEVNFLDPPTTSATQRSWLAQPRPQKLSIRFAEEKIGTKIFTQRSSSLTPAENIPHQKILTIPIVLQRDA